MTSPDPRDRIGNVIGGKYRIVRFIAEGGMGAVYEASHLVVQRRFALKFLRSDLGKRRDTLARFRREAITSGSLESDNIAAALDLGMEADGTPYIVMEYLAGIDLGQLLSSTGPLPLARATEIVLQACRGIQWAHAGDVIHRDLKPRNLVLCRRDEGFDWVKIVDFGLARLVTTDERDSATKTGGALGTAAYMSPEQARGDARIDHRTDLYSLGVVLYELLTGSTPHPGNSYNAVIHHILTQAPLPLSSEFPAPLRRDIERALARDPADRFQSAEELIARLLPFAERTVWPAQAEHRASVDIGEAPTLPEPRPEADELDPAATGPAVGVNVLVPTASRSRLPWLVVGATALVLSVSVLWTVGQTTSPVRPSPSVRSATSQYPTQLPAPRSTAGGATEAGRVETSREPAPLGDSRSSNRERARPTQRPPQRTRTSNAPPPSSQPIGVKGSFDANNPYD